MGSSPVNGEQHLIEHELNYAMSVIYLAQTPDKHNRSEFFAKDVSRSFILC